jgi:ATP-dependent DNA ligase I
MVFTTPVPATVAAFHSLCMQIQSENSLTIKSQIIQGFTRRYTGDLVILFKLLLPKYTGRVYRLKDKQLIKHLSSLLHVHEGALKDHADKTGCIATSAAHYFKPTASHSTMSIDEFEAHLVALAAVSADEQQRECLRKFLAVATKEDLFIYLREVKLDLRLGAGLRIVLNGLHPSANEIFKQCSNITDTVKRVQAGETDIAAGDGGGDDDDAASGRSTSPTRLKAGRIVAAITLGTPISPMLASPSKGAAGVIAKCPNGCYSETKYDGERIQIHKQGATFSFFSRANKPMKPDKYEGLEKYITAAVRAADVVLDGEILLVDTRTSQPLPFGTLGKHKKAQFDTANTAIFLFDILYLDGESLLNRPLDWRRDKLRQCVEPIPSRILFSDLRIISGTKDQQVVALNKHLQFAIRTGLEGLVVKDMKSTYEPGSRHWIKLKKDYLEGMGDTADLIVLGAWYGTGARGGKLSTFLMGVLDTSLPQSAPRRFKTVTSVANGLDDAQLAALQPVFLSTMVPTGGVAPAWLDVHSSNMPDMVPKDPYSAPVWEIMCNEYTVSKVHTARTISMRFGRIVRIRDDKDPMTATSLDELVKLVQASKESAQQGPGNDPTEHDGYEREDDVAARYVSPTTAAAAAAAAASGHHPHHRAHESAKPAGLAQPRLQFPAAASSPAAAVAAQWSGAAAASPPSASSMPPPSGKPPGPSSPHHAATAPAKPSLQRMGTHIASTPVQQMNPLLRVVAHDVAQPITVPGIPQPNLLILHVAALHGRWSTRGVMGAITRVHGDECREAYDAASRDVKMGDLVVVEISNRLSAGRLFVATAIGQLPATEAGRAPQIDHEALSRAFAKAAGFAKKNDCSIHFARPDRSTGIRWPDVESMISTHCTSAGIHVTVYSREASAPSAGAHHSPGASVPMSGSLDHPPAAPPRTSAPGPMRTSTAHSAASGSPPQRVATSNYGASPPPRAATAAPATSVTSAATHDGGSGGASVLAGCTVVVLAGDPDDGHLTKRQAEATKQKAMMLGASHVFVQQADHPCPPTTTHVVAEAEVPRDLLPLGGRCFVVQRAWIDASFAENRRMEETKYGVGVGSASVAPSAAPPVKKHMTEGQVVPRGSVSGLFNLLDPYRIVISTSFPASEREELANKVRMMGGLVQDQWGLVGAARSTHFIAPFGRAPGTTECPKAASVESMGGTVVSRLWVDNAFDRAAVGPATQYRLVPVAGTGSGAADHKQPSPLRAAVASPPAKPAVPTGPQHVRRARTPDVSDLVAYIATATQRLKDFASGHHHVDLPAHMRSWRVFVTGYAPDLANALRAAADALGFKRAPSGEHADVVIADTLSEVAAHALTRPWEACKLIRMGWVLQAADAVRHHRAMPKLEDFALNGRVSHGALMRQPSRNVELIPAPVVATETVEIKGTNAPASVGKQGAAFAASSPKMNETAAHNNASNVPTLAASPVKKATLRRSRSASGDSEPPPARRAPRAEVPVSNSDDDATAPPPPARRRQPVPAGESSGDDSASTMSYDYAPAGRAGGDGTPDDGLSN